MMRKAEKKIALKWKNPRKRDRTEILDEKRKKEEDKETNREREREKKESKKTKK